MQKKVDNRFYTTAMTFANDLGSIVRSGIISEPPIRPETAVSRELERGSTIKKVPLDLKERRRQGKRIINTTRPQLEAAVKAEAEISGKPVDKLLKELHDILDSSYIASHDYISVSLGDAASVADNDADQDTEMVDATQSKPAEEPNANQDSPAVPVAGDVDLPDIDAPCEEDEIAVAATPAGDDALKTGTPIAEVDADIPQKGSRLNTVEDTDTPPAETNGYAPSQEVVQPAPPTPPVSNGGSNTDPVDILANGGIPFYLKDFEPEGTSLVQAGDTMSNFSEELSEMGDEELRGLGDDVNAGAMEIVRPVITATPAKKKPKKKARKRW